MNDQHINQFSYSTDGKNFKVFGTPYKLSWGGYRGDYIGIFNYNTIGESGWVDVDWFRYSF